jgi:hypothetical protein
VTSVFDDMQRTDPAAPLALSPQAAQEGGPDSGGGLNVDFFVRLGATLGTLADTLQSDRDKRQVQTPPSETTLFASGVFPSTGPLVLDLGAVPLGRVWQVRLIIVGGVTVTTTAVGQAYVFRQGAPPSDLNLANCVWIFNTMPQGATFGTHQLFAVSREHLYVAFAAGTSGQQYATAMRVEEWDAGSFIHTGGE